MRQVLLAAALYNVLWGAWTVLFPAHWFAVTGMPQPNYPELWQCIGMIVGVYGVGYAAAALSPYTHWPIVLVGLLGKIFGPIGFAWAISQGRFSPAFGLTIVTNDLIWWVPFFLILKGAYTAYVTDAAGLADPARVRQALTEQGDSVAGLLQGKTLLVALRHSGCTFCREMLDDLSRARKDLQVAGYQLVLMHTSPDPQSFLVPMLEEYRLADLPRVADASGHLYRALDLGRGRVSQLFGPRVWVRGMEIFQRYGLGWLDGDGFQMPGAFVFEGGQLVWAFRAQSAEERLPLQTLLQERKEAK
jgi:hypothetical protein